MIFNTVALPSVAQNGRLAYSLLGEVTDRDMRGDVKAMAALCASDTAVGAIWVASKFTGLKINE